MPVIFRKSIVLFRPHSGVVFLLTWTAGKRYIIKVNRDVMTSAKKPNGFQLHYGDQSIRTIALQQIDLLMKEAASPLNTFQRRLPLINGSMHTQ